MRHNRNRRCAALSGLLLAAACANPITEHPCLPPDAPLDLEALVEEFPSLKSKVFTAPEALEAWREDFQPTSWPDRICPGSSIHVQVIGRDESSRWFNVPPDGELEFDSIGKIDVDGMTGEELAGELRDRLRPQGGTTEVLVSIRTGNPLFCHRGVAVVLIDGRPARIFELSEPTSVFKLVPEDLPDDLSLRSIRLVRRAKRGPLIVFCDMREFQNTRDIRQDFPVFHGDVIHVASRRVIGCGSSTAELLLEYAEGCINLGQLVEVFSPAFQD